MKHHLIIGGTGRSGTSLLVKYLTECGLETHISRNPNFWWDENAEAGLEDLPLPEGDSPYVIKSPWLFECVDALVQREDITVDAVIMPVRNLVEAAASRSILELRARHVASDYFEKMKTWETWGVTPGGTVYSINPLDQARILAVGFQKTVHILVKHEIRIVFLDFPRLVEDGDYLYERLKNLLPRNLEKEHALKAHAKLVDLSKVRTGTEISAISNQGTPEQSKFLQSGIEYPSLDNIDSIALKRAISTLRKLSTECSSQRDTLALERNSLIAARDSLLRERDALAAERDSLVRARDSLLRERNALGAERDSLVLARDSLLRERDENAQRTAEYERIIASIHASVCWRLSWPIRWLHGYARRANRVLLKVRSLAGRS
jgi:hypothetical protein